jgi:hypothetical protein
LSDEHDRWLTYAEVGRLLGITPAAARMHVKRRGWQRRSPNAIGAHALVLVPDEVDVQPRAAAEQRTCVAQVVQPPNGHDQGNVQAISSAIEALREQLAIANRRIDDLTEERRRLMAALMGARLSWWRRWFR